MNLCIDNNDNHMTFVGNIVYLCRSLVASFAPSQINFVPSKSHAIVLLSLNLFQFSGRVKLWLFFVSVYSYMAGAPPCSLYIGHTPIKCHLLKDPKKACCLGLRNEVSFLRAQIEGKVGGAFCSWIRLLVICLISVNSFLVVMTKTRVSFILCLI